MAFSRYAIATTVMLGDSYMPGALVLAYTLRKNIHVPCDLIVMVTQEVTQGARRTLTQLFDYVIEVEKIQWECNVHRWGRFQSMYRWIHYCFTKMNIFQMDVYDKILLLDADMIALTSLDTLFTADIKLPTGTLSGTVFTDLPTGTLLTREMIINSLTTCYGIAGCTLLLHPDKQDFTNLLRDLTINPTYGNTQFNSGPDEQLITRYFLQKNGGWVHLGGEYSCTAWKSKELIRRALRLGWVIEDDDKQDNQKEISLNLKLGQPLSLAAMDKEQANEQGSDSESDLLTAKKKRTREEMNSDNIESQLIKTNQMDFDNKSESLFSSKTQKLDQEQPKPRIKFDSESQSSIWVSGRLTLLKQQQEEQKLERQQKFAQKQNSYGFGSSNIRGGQQQWNKNSYKGGLNSSSNTNSLNPNKKPNYWKFKRARCIDVDILPEFADSIRQEVKKTVNAYKQQRKDRQDGLQNQMHIERENDVQQSGDQQIQQQQQGIEGQQFIFEEEEEEDEEEDVDIEQDNNQKEMIVDKTDEDIDSKQEQEIEQQIPILEKSSEIEKLKDDSQQVQQQQQQSKSISSRIVSTNTNRFNIPISPLFASPNINNPFNTSQQLSQQEKQYKSPNQSIWKQSKSMNKDQQQTQAEMKPFLHLRQRRTKLIHFVTEKPWIAIGSDWPDFWVWKQEARELCSVARILHKQELYIERALESVSDAVEQSNE
ncbi:MAG: putative Glycosyl transferase family 8 protein, partial [Streblomastix strix]